MIAKTAWVFPGQGAQYPGMGRGFPFAVAVVRGIFEEAEALCGQPLRRLAQEASADTLRDPAVLEPMLTAFALSYAALLQERGHQPSAVAGYSAGAIAALCCAGVIDRASALTIAARRGRLLREVAPRHAGRLTAAFDLSAEKLLAVTAADDVEVAGWNAPDHLTFVASESVMREVIEKIAAAGGHCFPVDVAGAWHSERAAPVAEHVARLLQDFEFKTPRIPFYCSVSGTRESAPERLCAHLAAQIHRPVMWHAAIGNLRAREGIDRFLEVGCGRTLHGLTRRVAAFAGDALSFLNLYQHLEPAHA